MVKRTKKQKVWNNYKNKLYGKSRKRDTKHNSSGMSYRKNDYDYEPEPNWIKPFNIGM